MKILKHKRIKQIGVSALIILTIVLAWSILKPKDLTSNILKVPVKKGLFEISVTTTGELEAKSSENLLGPNVRKVGIHSAKIEHIVPNGTMVKKGDYVASLNKSEIMTKIKEKEKEVEKFEAQIITTKLDTTISLRSARNDLLNQKIELEEIEIELEQSVYEPPSTIRQIEIKLDKFKRAFDQSKTSYQLKVEKEKAKMNEVTASLSKAKIELSEMRKLLKEFTIFAPKDGMVVHPRLFGRGGQNIIGRELNMYNPVVATLPNLDKLISKTYVNELDISKVKKGQKVKISVDAFPDQEYEGVVTRVANMGNPYMMTSSKLFEVTVELANTDNILKPSMTTKNKIIINTYNDVLFVPLESIHHDEEHRFVFTDRLKKEIVVGEASDNEVIIKEGLSENDVVCLSTPDYPESFRFVELQLKNE